MPLHIKPEMSTIAEIPGIESYIRRMVVDEQTTHEEISYNLKRLYPMITRGLSKRSIKRFCAANGIHASSRVSDQALDILVRNNVRRVGVSYGRRMMTGLLMSQGVRVCQLRVGQSLQRVNPGYHHSRRIRAHRLTNPVSYRSDYFGEKLHIDQNEKLVMFGITHVCAVDGYSGKIVAFSTMPVKNNITIYNSVYVKVVREYGLWTQLRVDKGREWYLMLYVQQMLSQQRTNLSKPSFLQTSSKQNHIIERLWVEVNGRVNYPVKRILVEMESAGNFNMNNDLDKHCVSWFTTQVVSVGIKLFVQSWNNHPIPGRRRGGMRSHVPNNAVNVNNRVARIDLRNLPSGSQAVCMYHQNGGRLSEESAFGKDPLEGDSSKISVRDQAFRQQFPSFDTIYYKLVNSDPTLFKNGLKLYTDITYRLSMS